MPTMKEGIDILQAARVLYAPGKAANAGGVAVSGLEMSQNSMRLAWSREDLNERLRKIMRDIHARCVRYGSDGDRVDYLKGANIAGFVKVAEAVRSYGIL